MSASTGWVSRNLGRMAAVAAAVLTLSALQVVHALPVLAAPAGCTITGTSGPDRLSGDAGRDVICGRGNADRLFGRGGNDQLRGAGGDDRLKGGAGRDRLGGGRGDDVLVGGPGNDRLNGRDARGFHDVLKCGPGPADRAVADPGDTVRRSCEIVTQGPPPTDNADPAAADDTATADEDVPGAAVDVLANDTDPDGDSLSVTSVDTAGTAGQVTANGTDVTYDPHGAFESLAAGDTDTDTFSYTVSDGRGGSDSASVTVTVTGANDAPVIADVEPAALAYAASDPATVITTSATVTDVDSADFGTGTLTVNLSAGGAPDDRLEIRNQGAGAGQIGVSGSGVTYGGTALGTFTGGTGTVPLVITLNAEATPAATEALVRAITYRNVSASPSTEDRTAGFVLTDGDGDTSSPATRVVTIGPDVTDDPSVAVDDTATVPQGASATAVPVLANDTDVDGGPKTISAASDPAHGTVVLTGGTPDSRTGLTYRPDPGYCNDPPGGGPDAFTYTLNGGSTATVFMTVTCASNPNPNPNPNAAPVISGLEGVALAYTEDDPATVVTATGTVTDADSADFAGGALTVDLSTGGQAEDRLDIRNQGTGAGQISIAGSNVSYAGTTIGSFAGGTGTTPLVITLNASATPAATQALVRDVTYRNASDAPTTTARTARFVLTDGDGGTSAPATRDIAVAAVDDDPVAVDDGATVLQDASAAAVVVLTNDTDVDGGPMTISSASDPAHGTVVLTGGSAGAHTGLTYQPDPGYCNNPAGGGPDTFTYTLNGGSTATVSMTVTCAAGPNAAPVIAALEGPALAYTENDPAAVITATATVTDADSADFSTGTLTVDFSAGGQAEDRLEIRNQGTGAGQIGVTGSNITYGGTTIGSFAGGTGTTPLVITLNASATPAAAEALVRNVTYRNASAAPSTTTRTARFVLTDGDGGTSAPATRQITVAAVDDDPVAVDDSATALQDASAAAVSVLANDIDVDGGPMTISSASDPTHGTVVLTGGSAGAHTGLTYQPDPGYCNNPAGGGPDTFTYTLNGGSSGTVSMTVTCGASPNVAPVVAGVEGAALAYTENDAATVITASATVTDVDSADFAGGALTVDFSAGGQAEDRLEIRNQGTGASQIGVSGSNVSYGGTTIGSFAGGTGPTPLMITLNASATPAATQALVRNITYRNVSDAPSTVTRTARFVLTDGDGGTSAAATRQIVVASANDAPVIAGIEAGTLAYGENDPATVITATATVTDVDSANFFGGTLTVDFSAGGQAEDRLEIRDQGTGAGQIGVSGSNVTYGGTTIGTFTGGTGTTPLVVTLNAGAGAGATQALVRDVTYRDVSASPVTAARTARFVLTDGAGGTSVPATRVINIASTNSAPVVTTTAGSLAHVEGEAAEATDPGLTVTDSDSANLVSATVQVTGNYATGEDVLSATPPAGIVASFNAGSGTLTLSGSATVATYQTALRAVRYQDVSDAPSTLARTVTFVVNDGLVDSAAATKGITVTPVNDAPVVAGLESAALAYGEGGPATPITGSGTVSDVDSANFAGGTLTVDFSAGGQAEDRLAIRNQGTGAGQIGVSGANVSYGGTTIGTFTGGTGTTPLVVTLNAGATSAATQALLRNVTYADVSDAPSTTTRTARFVLTDGDGGTSAPATRGITVTPVNDAPVIAVVEGGALAYVENAAATVVTATGTVADVDSANFAGGTLTVDFSAGGQAEDRLAIRNQGTGAGQIGVSGANVSYGGTTIGTFTGGTGTTPLVVTLNAGATPTATQALLRNVTYADVSDAPSTTARTARFVLTDGDGGTSAPATRQITVSAVDDAPVLTASGGSTAYTEQAAAVTVDGGLTATDPDTGVDPTGATVTLTSPVAGDTLHFTTQNGVSGSFAAGVLTLSGSATLAQYQTALRSVQFSNATSDAPGASRQVGFRITTPIASNTSTKTIAISQVNDPPVVFLDLAGPLAYTEQAGFVDLYGPASTVTDPDSTTLSSIKVTIGTGYDAVLDTLRLDPAVTGFTSSYTGGVLTITKAGGTPAQFQTALRGVQFSNTDNDPDNRNDGTANPTDADRTITVVTDDGAAGGTTPPLPRLLSITPVNDAPGAPTLPSTTGVRNTTLVSGATTTEPHVTRTVNLVGSSIDPDGLESSIAVVPVTAVATAQSGRITLAANGNLRYEPPASATLTSDTYAYSLTDGTTSSAPITFTVTLSGAVWYVADGAPLPRDGTAARPFDTVAAGLAAAGSGQPVHIRRASGDGVLSGTAVLAANDKLLGEGVALTNTDVGSATSEMLFPAGAKPVLTAASGFDVVTLASNAQVAGLSINPDGAANGVVGASTSGVVLRSMDVTDTGTAATQPGIELTGTGNGLTFTAPVSVSTTQAGALSVTNAVLAGTLASTSVSGSTTSPGVSLTNTTGSLTFTTTNVTTTNQPGFVLNNVTNIDVTAGTVAATNRAAVDATGLAAGSDLAFTDVDSTNSTGDGVNLDGTDTAWTFSAGSGSTITGAATVGFDVNNGSGAVTYAGAVGATGEGVEVTSRTGNTTFSGNITAAGTGITVDGNTAGTTSFTGAAKTISSGAATAVSLTNNAGHTIVFNNGGLDIDTTTGVGFSASGGGTVFVSPGATPDTIGTGAGTGVSIVNTTIGNITLTSVSSNGAPSGIVLTNTGKSGGFAVNGTGAASSGGVIQNTTGPGVSLANTGAVSFKSVRIQGSDRSGIQGTGVTGFAFELGAIVDAGDSHVDDNDSAIAFNDTAGGMNNNVDGPVLIQGNTFTNPYGGGVDIFNYAGTITQAVISGNTITSSTDPSLSRRSGIALNLFGSSTTVASLNRATISQNTVVGFPSGDGISIQGASTASSTAPAGTYGAPGSATDVVTIDHNSVAGDPTNKLNGFGISASVTGRGQGNFVITANGTTSGGPLRNMKSSAIAIGAAGDVAAYFTVTNNDINANNGFSTAGIALGTDKNIQADLSTLSHPNVRATITGNTVANTSGPGFRILHRDSNGTLDLRLENNTNTGVQGLLLSGIRVENGSSGNAAYSPALCASIANNTATSAPLSGSDKNSGINLYKASSTVGTYTFGLVGLASPPATAAEAESYVAGLNPASETGQGFFAGKKVTVRTGDQFSSCTLPSDM